MRRALSTWIILVSVLLLPLVLAAPNDPGHDTLYIEETGDSELTGNLNITDELKVANLFYSQYLRIQGNGSTPSTSVPHLYALDNNNLYLGATQGIYLGQDAGSWVYILTSSGLNVSQDIYATGDIYTGGSLVQKRVSGTCGADEAIDTVNADGTVSCQSTSGSSTAGGWTNTSTTTSTALDVNITARANTAVPLTVQGAASQSANLQEWQNSSGGVLTVVDESGKIGIGTAGPGSPLHIVGSNDRENPSVPSLLALSDSNDSTKALRLGYDDVLDRGVIAASDLATGWKDIVIAPHGGKVGIGTNDPNVSLHVDGDINVTTGNDICISSGNCLSNMGTDQVGTVTDTYVCLGQSGSIVACDDAGITYVDATDALTVVGSINVGSNGLFANSTNVGIGDSTPDLNFEIVNSTANGAFAVSATEGGNGDLFIVDENGKVGIGTSSPSLALTVKGGIGNVGGNYDQVGMINTLGGRTATYGGWNTCTHGATVTDGEIGTYCLGNNGSYFEWDTTDHRYNLDASITYLLIGGHWWITDISTGSDDANVQFTLEFYDDGDAMWRTASTVTGAGWHVIHRPAGITAGDVTKVRINVTDDRGDEVRLSEVQLLTKDLSGEWMHEFQSARTGYYESLAVGEHTMLSESSALAVAGDAQIDGTTFFVNAANDRVGIGTNDPNSSLDVIGTVNATKVCDKSGYCLDTIGAAAGDVTGPGSSTDNAIARFHETTGKIIQNSGVTIDDSNDMTVTGGRVTGANSEYISIGETNDHILFVTGDGTPLVIDDGGYVGVGTESPGAKLTVNPGTIASTTNLVGLRLQPTLSAGCSGWTNMSTSLDYYIGSTVNGDLRMIRTACNNGVDFTVNLDDGSGISQERMRITEAGDVGIGTTSPGYKLDVTDRMRVRQGGAGTAGIWFYQTTPAANRAFVGMAADDEVGFWGSTGASWGLVMNTTNGNVGVGDLTPDFDLEIVNGSANGAFAISSTESADGDMFVVDENGNVGIGTDNPGAKLEVRDTSSPQLLLSYNDSNYGNFSVNSSGDMVIDATGDVIIMVG